MTITTKAILNINFTKDDKEMLEKACKLVDDCGLCIRNTLDSLDNKNINVDRDLLDDCYKLISNFEDACDSLDDLITEIQSFEEKHC